MSNERLTTEQERETALSEIRDYAIRNNLTADEIRTHFDVGISAFANFRVRGFLKEQARRVS